MPLPVNFIHLDISTCGTLDDPRLRRFDALDVRGLVSDGAVRYLISLDFDGTLREEVEPCVNPAFIELMSRWHPQGVRWGINTGRNLRTLLGEYLIDADILPDFVCSCERYVYCCDRGGELLADYDYNRGCYAAHEELRLRYGASITREFARMGQRHPDVSWETDPSDSLSIAAVDEASMEQLMPVLYEIHRRYPELGMQRAARFLRFCDVRYNKGTALRQVATHWQVAEKDCFLMGDGENDLDAFRLFPEASCAAPSHSHPIVLDYVRARGGDTSSSTVMQPLLDWGARRGLH